MPQCAVGDRYICPNAHLQGRHFCAIYKKELNGPYGEFNNDDGNIALIVLMLLIWLLPQSPMATAP
jgi:hypothetical protein